MFGASPAHDFVLRCMECVPPFDSKHTSPPPGHAPPSFPPFSEPYWHYPPMFVRCICQLLPALLGLGMPLPRAVFPPCSHPCFCHRGQMDTHTARFQPNPPPRSPVPRPWLPSMFFVPPLPLSARTADDLALCCCTTTALCQHDSRPPSPPAPCYRSQPRCAPHPWSPAPAIPLHCFVPPCLLSAKPLSLPPPVFALVIPGKSVPLSFPA